MRGMALAADTLSAAFFIGAAGAVYAWGFDGLAYGLGIGAGLLLLQLLIAPGVASSPAQTVPGFFGVRFSGRSPRVAASAAVAVSMFALLVAQLMAGGLATALLFGCSLSVGIASATGLLVLCFIAKRVVGSVWLGATVFALMLAALLWPTVDFSATWYGLPVPQLAHADALWKAQQLEETLLFDDLADPTYMRTLIRPFLSVSLMNFLGLVLGLAAGTAALAHVLSRHVTARPAREARWGLVWGLGFAVLFLTATTAAAAYFKVSLLTLIAGRVDIANLPEWIFTYGRIGLLEVCGRAATDMAAVTAACAQLPDASPVLRLQDLTISPDAILLALPAITGMGSLAVGFVAATVLLVALVVGTGMLSAIVGALTGSRGESLGVTALAVAVIVAVLAGLAATSRPSDVLTVATWGFLVAAAGLFPALAAATWWRRASSVGVAAGIVSGLAVALFYLVGTRYFAVSFYETWSSLSSAGPMATEFFAEYKADWMSAAPGTAKDAAWKTLDTHAQAMADWYGIKPVATALLALPVGLAALIVVSLLTPERERG